ncbi:hypothetical protein QCA50_018435 [Cerrena zonata]|uniref:Uncharacterized protein n=1 Tax=Cerrena zonata TaxID=2478898 RepID=A0AAW0FB22_9APHY
MYHGGSGAVGVLETSTAAIVCAKSDKKQVSKGGYGLLDTLPYSIRTEYLRDPLVGYLLKRYRDPFVNTDRKSQLTSFSEIHCGNHSRSCLAHQAIQNSTIRVQFVELARAFDTIRKTQQGAIHRDVVIIGASDLRTDDLRSEP